MNARSSTWRRPARRPGLWGLASGFVHRLVQGLTARSIPRSGPERTEEGCEDKSCGLFDATRKAGPPFDRIEVGQRLPIGGFPILEEEPGRIRVVYFMRSPGCSICRAHVRTLATRRVEIDALGADILVVHPGDSRSTRALQATLEPQFPIVASGEIQGPVMFPICGTLVIDGRGLVRSVRLSRLPFRGFHETQLMAMIRRIEGEV